MATKVFDHAVIFNGVFYDANTPIEVEEPEKDKEPTEAKKTAKKAVKKNDTGTSENA